MTSIELVEYEKSNEHLLSPTSRTALLAVDPQRLAVLAGADPHGVVLRASSWVGAIALPDATVRIRPKPRSVDESLTVRRG